jgi:hypothetical protein
MAFLGDFGKWLIGSSPAGIAGQVASSGIGSIFDGFTKLIEEVHLPPEKAAEIKLQLATFQLQTYQANLADIASARQMQMATRSRIPGFLAILVTFGFFGLLVYLFHYDVPQGNKDILNIMLGSLGTAWVMVMTFYFGDSHGSQTKTQMLGDIAKQP